MKKLVSFKHFVIALAMTFAGLATFSACKDQNYDFDAAHALTDQEKFTDIFIEQFGKPASGHQWGFDLSWEGSLETRAVEYGKNFAMIKPDTEDDAYNFVRYYGTVPNITEREHVEVLDWFTNHQVTWTNTTGFTGDHTASDVYVNFDGVHSTRSVDGPIAKIGNGYSAKVIINGQEVDNSLPLYTPEYWLNTPEVGLTIDFTHAWIQHVADDPSNDDIDNDGLGRESRLLNQLRFYEANGTNGHTFDYNASNGYGWGNQDDVVTWNAVSGVRDAYSAPRNGALVVGANFNNTAYSSSANSGMYHDKWIIVYLCGEDYSGWYLGFDLEGGGTTAAEQIHANGICNDWIIKLTSVDKAERHETRLLCEDLGAIEGKNGSDIDYNDIVADIDYAVYKGLSVPTSVTLPASASIPQRGQIYVTPVAAGGTLPLVVEYDDQPLFEVHELLLQQKTFFDNSHTMSESEYKRMLNTNAPKQDPVLVGDDDISHRTFTINFFTSNMRSATNHLVWNASSAIPSWNDLWNNKRLKLKVHRTGAADYIHNATSNSIADWVILENRKDGAPVMLCVPQTTNWLQERHKMDLGYSQFSQWVASSQDYFWHSPGTRDVNHLYNNLTTSPDYVIPELIESSSAESDATRPVFPEFEDFVFDVNFVAPIQDGSTFDPKTNQMSIKHGGVFTVAVKLDGNDVSDKFDFSTNDYTGILVSQDNSLSNAKKYKINLPKNLAKSEVVFRKDESYTTSDISGKADGTTVTVGVVSKEVAEYEQVKKFVVLYATTNAGSGYAHLTIQLTLFIEGEAGETIENPIPVVWDGLAAGNSSESLTFAYTKNRDEDGTIIAKCQTAQEKYVEWNVSVYSPYIQDANSEYVLWEEDIDTWGQWGSITPTINWSKVADDDDLYIDFVEGENVENGPNFGLHIGNNLNAQSNTSPWIIENFKTVLNAQDWYIWGSNVKVTKVYIKK